MRTCSATGVFGNPHSTARPREHLDPARGAVRRAAILRFLHASPDEYDGRLHGERQRAFKLVGEAYPFREAAGCS